ncbi:hypothetical protein [Metabacillus arenae]|uniref:Uncharacterized protein n=1 Tax=Metabacillus arenae TaxID=2771434 RepID=A0A926NFZ7_9BACI|nr:hypothetical protein [Metabacillus arenae]MBD1379813.1 hypothetical protein [Metabacillus arenae]
MDHIQRKTDSNPAADEEALSTVSKQEGDLEWKRFIQKELKKLENQEKDEGKEDSEKTSSAETEFNFSSLIEKIPLEKLIDSAVRNFKKKIESEKTDNKPKKEKKESNKHDYKYEDDQEEETYRPRRRRKKIY